MAEIQLTGWVNEKGQLELVQPVNLPPGEVRVIIETISPEEEAADEARWSASFAASQEQLARMADEALKDYDEGRTDELNPDSP
jgi:hypothetical protein